MVHFLGKDDWPAGKYALPQPKSGCPKNWIQEKLFQESDNGDRIYKDFHLAGKVNKQGKTSNQSINQSINQSLSLTHSLTHSVCHALITIQYNHLFVP